MWCVIYTNMVLNRLSEEFKNYAYQKNDIKNFEKPFESKTFTTKNIDLVKKTRISTNKGF